MAAYLLDSIPVRQLDSNGDPVPGALLYTYRASTVNTPLATYTNAAETTPHANPIVADGAGYWPATFLSASAYKLVARLPSPDGISLGALLWERDGVQQVIADGTLKGAGAAGDGVTNDTAAWISFLADGGGRVTPGIYMVDEATINNLVDVRCEAGAIFRKRSAPTAASILIRFAAGSEGSYWQGGEIDGNRALLAGAFSALNPSYPGYFAGWFGMKTAAADITVRDVRFTNWVTKPAWFAGDYNLIDGVTSEDCGDAILFGYEWFGLTKYATRPAGDGARGQQVDNIKALRTANNGVTVAIQHAIDLQGCLGGTYSSMLVDAQGGDVLGVSSTASGITAENCDECFFGDWTYLNPTTDVLAHLAFSLLGCRNCTLPSLTAYNFAGLALEHNACQDCIASSVSFDGNYRVTTAVPLGSALSLGVSYYDGAWNSDRSSKSQLGTSGCRILGGTIQRLSYGANLRGASQFLQGVNIFGCLVDGVVIQEQLFTDHFAGDNLAYNHTELTDCRIERNGSRGVSVISGREVVIRGGSLKNNGQDTAEADDARTGVTAAACSRLSIVGGAIIGDDQAWTDTDTCSFEPQSSVNGRVVVYIREMGRIGVGQALRIVGGQGGGVDYVGRVYDISPDDAVTLHTSTPFSLSATGNTVALTGTWSGSGTVLTGVGTLATTEIRGQTWVTNGSQWRRVVKATANLQVTLNEAFSAPLAGTALTALMVDVSGIPTQTQGVRAFGSVTQIMLDPANVYEGNLLHRTNLSTPANCLPGAAYYRKTAATTNSGTINLQTAIPAGHRLLGVATNNDVAISGGGVASWELRLRDSGLATLESIQAGLALPQNTKLTGSVAGARMLAAGNLLSAVFSGGAPTAGSIACEALYRVDGVQALPNA